MRQTDAPDRAHAHAPRWAASLAVVAALLLAACGATGAGDANALRPQAATGADGGDMQRDLAGGDPAATGDEEAGGDGGGSAPLAIAIEQRIIKTGEISIEVESVANALARVRAMTLELGGYVGGSQAGTLDDRATLTLRIPAERFEEALARLHELEGEVLVEATREQDVTSQIVDLEARIENLEASEASYRLLLERAERIEDILAVQSRLDQVRGEIEQLRAQLENVTNQADLSTLTVTLVPQAEPVEVTAQTWDPGAELSQAIASLLGIGQGLVSALIWFAVVWVPILLVLSALALLALRGLLELRRRVPVAGATSGEPPAA